jgi:membrane-bound lytic murein transglycosylase B
MKITSLWRQFVKKVNRKKSKLINKSNSKSSKRKFVALSFASRMIALVMLTAIIPAYATNTNISSDVNYDSNIVLDKNSNQIIKLNDDTKKIVVGESEFDKKNKQVAIDSKRSVVARESRSYIVNDVSLEQKRELAKKAANAYGIDWKVLEAVWQVESGKQYVTNVKSYAGAQGPMQFMNGTWKRYAVDGNNDGVKDINNAEDAVYAAANLLAQAGASSGNVDKALFSYNHAQWYVDKVNGVANSIIE